MGFGMPDLQFLFSAQNLGFDGRICTLGHLTTYTTRRSRTPSFTNMTKRIFDCRLIAPFILQRTFLSLWASASTLWMLPTMRGPPSSMI
jgi:hypothetical protein